MENKSYYKKLHEQGLETTLYTSYLSKVYGESIDKDRAKKELLNIHQKLKLELDEANFHVRMISTPATLINSTEVYTMNEALDILQVSRSKLRELIKESIVSARIINKRNWQPFKWSVDAYANGLSTFIANESGKHNQGEFITHKGIEMSIEQLYISKENVILAIKQLLSRKKKILNYLNNN